jgi:cytochrome d ubiquinol oxidase subunit I
VLRVGLTLAAVLIPLQIVAGDLHGLNTLQHQPQKIAAMEGIWDTERGAPLLLFAMPDEKTRSNHFEIGVPRGAAADPQARRRRRDLKGLNDFPNAHPPVAPLFWSASASWSAWGC